MPSKASAAEQIALLEKGADRIEPRPELRAKVERSVASGEPLRVKVGFDPSAPDLHLGHTVVMRKMKHFQDFGHEVWFVIGDFTGMIGDPSGRSKTRPQLTEDQIRENAETYKEQVFKILDPEKTVVAFNSEWLSALGAEGLIRLASRYTVARMLERDDFHRRFRGEQPISIHEFLYPLAQSYDSVAMKADFELGGTDQLFNLLVGRHIMREYGLEPQVALTMPLLEGLNGTEKMSKSLGNAVGVTEPPDEMFGKLMSISDELTYRYYELLTDRTPAEIAALRAGVDDGTLHPKRIKQDLAVQIVSDFHSREDAEAARDRFEAVFARGTAPDEMPSFAASSPMRMLDLLTSSGLARSRGEGRRLLSQGAVSLDGERVLRDVAFAAPADGAVVKVGKRRFLRVLPAS
ncbi:MAG: tyrosine--tRNA ligase [Acidobacteriota bacterium]|nr:tyrosine--tRNA ligase [Acidobacteriota bacterium]MDE2711452.1 tyrosine--tRNA ligase [Acidobacteriota bacterium]MXW71859.1 tyrosine--tRNA ligase [Acidobacteriota bacterium]MYE42526.1 tyrosine--tRNA ligase [Acidobacteriota bacterium]